MKLYERLLIALGVMSLAVLGLTGQARAQASGVQPIWANYNVQYVNVFYNPLAGGTLIPVTSFINFTGSPDADDGTADSIPVGFPFIYNENMYAGTPFQHPNPLSAGFRAFVNVNVNGFVTVGPQPIPVTPNNNNNLFSSTNPNNTLAPYWGDHYYRTLEPGYIPSRISYSTVAFNDPNPNAPAGSQLHIFTVEWRDLNVNDKTNPNSIASFQLRIIENPMANDRAVPDHRATIEYQYGPIGTTGTVTTVGAAVGAEDSVGFTHINALFPSSAFNGDSTRLNTTARSNCWPPATCLPGRAIQLVPAGRAILNQWGDGDVNLDQVYNPNDTVRRNQSRFVTELDADLILQSRAGMIPPLDSVEGRAAFHGDANHTGRVYNPTYGAYFYHVTSYDAAYIMMYLAGKLAVLPWPNGLGVPGFKSTENPVTNVSGIVADASNVMVNGNTVRVPITVRGTVNGLLSVEMNVDGMDANGLQFVGTRAVDGVLMEGNVTNGAVALATAGKFSDGATLGYLEFNVSNKNAAAFDLTNVTVNDEAAAGSHVALKSAGIDGQAGAMTNLAQNAPNPFVVSVSGHTTIGFDLANQANVTLRVFDMLGHEVRTLVNDDVRSAGHHSIEWDGRDAKGNVVASGLYYYQLVTPDFTQMVKMQVIR